MYFSVKVSKISQIKKSHSVIQCVIPLNLRVFPWLGKSCLKAFENIFIKYLHQTPWPCLRQIFALRPMP